MEAEPEFAFGPFRLDPPNARLTRGRQAVALQPKAFDVLAYLVRHAGRLVTQDELIRAVWPDTIVGDSSLKSCVRQIRRALGDRVRDPQYIETVHRRGYRFVAPLTAGGGTAPSAAPPHLAAPPADQPGPGRCSWAGGRNWAGCATGWPRRGPVSGNWCSSPAGRGAGRPPWSKVSCVRPARR